MPGVHASCPAPSKQAVSSALAPGIRRAHGAELQMTTGEPTGNAWVIPRSAHSRQDQDACARFPRHPKGACKSAGREPDRRHPQRARAASPSPEGHHRSRSTQRTAVSSSPAACHSARDRHRSAEPGPSPLLGATHRAPPGGLDHVFALKLTLGAPSTSIYSAGYTSPRIASAKIPSLPRTPAFHVVRRRASTRPAAEHWYHARGLAVEIADTHTCNDPAATITVNAMIVDPDLPEPVRHHLYSRANVGVIQTHKCAITSCPVIAHRFRLPRSAVGVCLRWSSATSAVNGRSFGMNINQLETQWSPK